MNPEFKNVPNLNLPVLTLESTRTLYTLGVPFVDVRTDEEVAAGSIPGALHIPLSDIGNRISELEPFLESPVVLYCRSGARSDAAAQQLRSRGYLHAWNAGGYEDILGVLKTES